jgi:hypothetical protein
MSERSMRSLRVASDLFQFLILHIVADISGSNKLLNISVYFTQTVYLIAIVSLKASLSTRITISESVICSHIHRVPLDPTVQPLRSINFVHLSHKDLSAHLTLAL